MLVGSRAGPPATARRTVLCRCRTLCQGAWDSVSHRHLHPIRRTACTGCVLERPRHPSPAFPAPHPHSALLRSTAWLPPPSASQVHTLALGGGTAELILCGLVSGSGSFCPQRVKNVRKEVKTPHLLRAGDFCCSNTGTYKMFSQLSPF